MANTQLADKTLQQVCTMKYKLSCMDMLKCQCRVGFAIPEVLPELHTCYPKPNTAHEQHNTCDASHHYRELRCGQCTSQQVVDLLMDGLCQFRFL